MCEALTFLLDNIYIRFDTKLFRQIVGIPMSTNCAPLVADLFLFCYKRDFMMSLSVENQSEIIEAFISTSRYLDDLLNTDNTYFVMVMHSNSVSCAVRAIVPAPKTTFPVVRMHVCYIQSTLVFPITPPPPTTTPSQNFS